MSLIQQALEKTSRVQETRTANPSSDSKTYDRDPMGAALEQELIQVQQSYAKRRKLYWKVCLGALFVFSIGGLSYIGLLQIPLGGKSAPGSAPTQAMAPVATSTVARAVSPMPLNIFSGNIYRLTGITSIDGKSMAVINGEIVSVGDSLSGNTTVKAIGNGEVRLDVQGREIKLTL